MNCLSLKVFNVKNMRTSNFCWGQVNFKGYLSYGQLISRHPENRRSDGHDRQILIRSGNKMITAGPTVRQVTSSSENTHQQKPFNLGNYLLVFMAERSIKTSLRIISLPLRIKRGQGSSTIPGKDYAISHKLTELIDRLLAIERIF